MEEAEYDVDKAVKLWEEDSKFGQGDKRKFGNENSSQVKIVPIENRGGSVLVGPTAEEVRKNKKTSPENSPKKSSFFKKLSQK